MTQISPRRLDVKVKGQIYETFLCAIADLTTPSSTRNFLSDLLSDTEITMLGKRLSIAYMLRKGYTTRHISNVLKVSLTTINRVQSNINTQSSGYKQVVDRMIKEDKIVAFFEKISEKLDHALPPRGANWQEHYKNAEKRRRQKAKAF